jgi:1,4-alpha-glucan branching enzyme
MTKPILTDVEAVKEIIEATHWEPHTILGLHALGKNPLACTHVVRAWLPQAKRAWLITSSGVMHELGRVDTEGFFELGLKEHPGFPYEIKVENPFGESWTLIDPYQFETVLGELDLHLMAEGHHERLYDKLGAHRVEHQGVWGVVFAVWAPNARRVSVQGNFNNWDGRRHPMRSRGGSGIWELFVPGLQEGEPYKYEIRTQDGRILQKADPLAFEAEVRPKTASIVANVDHFEWSDNEWIAGRASKQALEQPISIYEVHLGSWRRKGEANDQFLTYAEIADELISYVLERGFTHIELLPVNEHPFDGSWGYQPTGYYAPTSRFGSPAEFASFVNRCHENGIGVILDWVPAHFPRDAWALSEFDGTCLYEHSDPRMGEHKDWGTKIFNYGRPEVRNFLISNALFWFDRYHIDGLRVDAVASMLYLDYSRKPGEWLPNQFGGNENLDAIDFLKQLNETCHRLYPGVLTIAEESTSYSGVSRPTYLGGLGFSLKWNMGWMNDTLRYHSMDPVHRKFHHNTLTFSIYYAFSENFLLPFSHDEVVHGKASLLAKMPGDMWQQCAGLRTMLAYQYAHPGKKLLFMGSEFGQRSEWNAETSLDWDLLKWPDHQGIQKLVTDLNRLYCDEPALHRVDFHWSGFEWLALNDSENSIIAFTRRQESEERDIICVCNFTPVPRYHYRIGVSRAGSYREVLNTDSSYYGGSNMGNHGLLHSVNASWGGKPYHLEMTIPPLCVLYLRHSTE